MPSVTSTELLRASYSDTKPGPYPPLYDNRDQLPTHTATAVQGTLTVLLALTTPFIPPIRCDVEELTSITTIVGENSTTILPLLYSNPADPNYTSCQPTEWANVTEPLRHSYSPAVCPTDWYALEVSVTMSKVTVIQSSKAEETIKPVATAWCCKPGYHLDTSWDKPPFETGTPVCWTAFNASNPTQITIPNMTMTDGDNGSRTKETIFSTGIALHPAWHIAWEKSDVSTLSPAPPSLTSDMRIPTWIPGQPVQAGLWDHNGLGTNLLSSTTPTSHLSYGVGIPVACIIIISCAVFWYHRRHRGSRESAAALRRASRAERQIGVERTQEDVSGALPSYTANDTTPRPPTYELMPIAK